MARIIKNNLGNFLVIVVIAVLVGGGIFYYLSTDTKGAESQQIKILPTDYSSNWQNSEAALVQDLGPEADFEDFNEENSTFPLAKAPQQEESIIFEPGIIEEEQIASPSEELIPEEELASPSEPFEESLVSPSESLPTLFDLIATDSFDELATESEIIVEEIIDIVATESEELIVDELIDDEIATESEDVILEVEPPIGFIEKTLEFSDFSVFEEFQDTEIKNVQLRLSMAAGKGTDQDKLIIEYSYDSDLPAGEAGWSHSAEFDLENEVSNATNNGYWLYALPIFENWGDLGNLKIRFIYRGQNKAEVYLDALWLEVEYEFVEAKETQIATQKDAEIELISKRKDFKLDEGPEFKFKYRRKKNIVEKLIDLFRDEYKDINIKVTVSGLNISPNIRYEGNGEFFVDLANFEKPCQFRPGTYVLKIEIEDEGQIYTQNQDFIWGVLAINVNKSIYLPGDRAYIQMGALTDTGHTICDANLKLQITSPDGGVTSPNVQRSGKCGPNNVTDVPDYFTYYQVEGTGIYEMKLINLDNGYEITDSFEVQDYVLFDIERVGPIRIYPPATYEMTLKIKANQDFAGEVVETVPAGFEVQSPVSSFEFQVSGSEKQLVWQVDWKAGETHELKYTFDALDISPYLYLLGPLKIGSFQEARQWQIAADSPGQFARPDGDIAVGSWSPYPSSPTTLWDKIDEVTQNQDTDYIVSSTDEDEYEVSLTDDITDPELGTGHKIRCYAKSPVGTGAKEQITISLVENGTVRASSLVTDVNRTSYVLIEYTLTEVEANAIGNYANLRFRVHINKTDEPIRITQAELEVPDVVVNDPPAFDSGYEPWENPESNDTTPTDMDADVTFKATATDPESDGWYLAVCKAEGISPGSAGVAPTCDSGTWVVSGSSSTSGTEIIETYTITSGETLESYAWYAYACDNNSDSACTTAYSNSGRTGTGGTPFSVNHRPTFTAVSDDSGKDPGGTVRVTADTYNDTDTGGSQDTVSMYVCTTAAFTGGGSPACDVSQWCNVTGVTPTATLACDLTVPNPAAHGTDVQNYWPYIVDNHGFTATSGKQGSAEAYDVNDVAPTISAGPSLNGGSAISLIGAEKSTKDIDVTVTITDDNGCDDIDATNTFADVYQYDLVASWDSCNENVEDDDNKCYARTICSYDSGTDACGAMPDITGGYKCTVSFQYYANPTDANTPWNDDQWRATLVPGDGQGPNSAGKGDATDVELESFLALDLAAGYTSIAYEANAGGDMDPGTNNDPLLEKTRVEATGNCALDVNLYGVVMQGTGTDIPIGNQRYASGSSAPTWAEGTVLVASTGEELELNVPKTITETPEWERIWWGIDIPVGQTAGGYSGTNTITAIKAEVADW